MNRELEKKAMKTIPGILVAALLFLSPQARAAGPGGVERVGAIDLGLNVTPANPLSVLYLQRAQLLRDQLYLTVDLKADDHALKNEITEIMTRKPWIRNAEGKSVYLDGPEELTQLLRDMSHAKTNIDTWKEQAGTYPAEAAKSLVASVDKKRHALEELKAMLKSVNAEIEAMKKAACSCSNNPKSSGAAASGPCSCG